MVAIKQFQFKSDTNMGYTKQTDRLTEVNGPKQLCLLIVDNTLIYFPKEFWASSSIVGISNAGRAQNNGRKLIWTVVFSCGLAW